ncbi:MAG TPA: NAD(P)H:quinone oxidoreductase [Polyangiaceae bacterium]|jgi:NAD(P)H dehydrogenase (quinone)|nr:MAG: NAD(P)H dehydrogenase (quinone) [Deltaproteobacteria bacterium ADurb.Bin207]HNZ23331.1 NAD(P)H:quinone oxidoreductase [Polyangiaceae bacterium]HOD21899.1 NAD(P)H:quinone oxidoreductase [Polyangiaceae bacterium]HOE49344.1 NAD(P)H:quinone oxidoreductase [Polyangiaceae bacterium]HOH00931.1 NAD(P)H:quinone oxidoreductase [Polyangiaceae bacterium]
MTKVAIIYYSSTGTNEAMARAVAEGAKEAGAEVRVRLVAETAPDAAISRNPAWRSFVDAHQNDPRASLDDLEWADAIIFGTPTRFGNIASQLKAFIDTTAGLWLQGKLSNKVYAGFTSAQNAHGGQESTLLALFNTVYHYGGFIVPPGYTDPLVFASGGNPYGPSVTVGSGGPVGQADLAHGRYLGKRVAEVASKLVAC